MTEATASAAKTLRVGLLTPVHHLDPRGKLDFESTMILSHVFEPPFAPAEATAEEEGPPEPLLLAGHLQPAEDGTFEAPVRPEVRFSDGTPLAAEIVAGSLARSETLGRVAQVEARDDRVVFRPTGAGARRERLEWILSQRFCGVVLERDGEALGTGPFRLDPAWSPERIRLVRNPEFRGEVHLEAVELVAYPPDEEGRPEALLEAVERGEVDFCNLVSREDVGRLKGVRKWLEPGSGTAILYFNTARPGLSDPEVRRALATAIHRAELARICYPNPVAFTATGLLPPMMGSFRDGISHDPKRAAVMLRSAAAGDPPERLSLLLIHGPRPYLPQPRPVAEEIARELDAVGIAVEVRETETLEDYFRRAGRAEHDLALSGWVADSTDPADFLETILSPDSVPDGSERHLIDGNLSHWRSEEMRRAIARFAAERSEEAKREVLEILEREVPLLPLVYGPTIFVYSQRVLGFEPSPLGIPEFHRMRLAE